MKISALDEYGLRILLRIARADEEEGLTIQQISELEGLSMPYAGKITRTLRMAALIQSTRGQKGGYVLAKPAENITIHEVLKALGGHLFDAEFCGSHSGALRLCTNSIDCSVRSLWRVLQHAMDQILERISLQQLLHSEINTGATLQSVVEDVLKLEVAGK